MDSSYWSRAYLQDAGAHVQAGRLDKALEIHRESVVRHPDDSRRHRLLSECLLGAGLPDESLSELRVALRLDPTNAGLWDVLAGRLSSSGDIPAALEACLKSVELAPKSIGTLHSLGTLYLKSDNVDAAIDAFETAALLNPKYIDARLSLAKAIGLNEERLQESLDALTKLTTEFPNHPYVRLAYGQALRRAGRPDEARIELEKAIAIADEYLPRAGRMEEYFAQCRDEALSTLGEMS